MRNKRVRHMGFPGAWVPFCGFVFKRYTPAPDDAPRCTRCVKYIIKHYPKEAKRLGLTNG